MAKDSNFVATFFLIPRDPFLFLLFVSNCLDWIDASEVDLWLKLEHIEAGVEVACS